MAEILVETKNKIEIDKKPRVYFTCHPDDFDAHFRRICDDIFKSQDCAVYYTANMTETIAEDERELLLGRSNLFVIPVTFKLLNTPSRAMDEDLPYALREHIPVLPIVMEPGIDEFYSRPDRFGELQYLYPFSRDLTEISYEEKLKKYLETVLISDETAKRIRAAFDAYIFLSYRKKDRRYANELMRIIHSNPECRDIAIWFDEFLTPGESFRENISRILSDSTLFALLVTPNLLEEPDGKPNFVMAEEYPAAHESGIEILPAEMVETDKAELGSKFSGIPECVSARDDEHFRARLMETLSRAAVIHSNDDPEHNFLIGLAYLEGIDVEVDRERGLEFITSAAEAGLPEAMGKLYDMYRNGAGVNLDYRQAVRWGERLADYYVQHHGEEHPDTLAIQNNLTLTYSKLGDYRRELELIEKVYPICCRVWGEDHHNTLAVRNNLAYAYSKLGDFQSAFAITEKAYILCCEKLGERHPNTLIALSNLAGLYSKLGDNQKAIKNAEEAYELCCDVFGKEHPDTLIALSNLASYYSIVGDIQKAIKKAEEAYRMCYQALGPKNPNTLMALNNLALFYCNSGDYEEAIKKAEEAYELCCQVLGSTHPNTLTSLNNLAHLYGKRSDYSKSLELTEKAYALGCELLGEDHPNMLTILNNLAATYGQLGHYRKAAEKAENVYALYCKLFGEEHPEAILALHNLAICYSDLGDRKKALEKAEMAYTLGCRILGEEHPSTLLLLENVAGCYRNIGNIWRALEMIEQAYVLSCRILGENHPDTLIALNNLATVYCDSGDYRKALEKLGVLYTKRRKLRGEKHPETLATLSKIAYIKMLRDAAKK